MINTQLRPIEFELSRDLSKHIKRGHPWIFQDALKEIPKNLSPGAWGLLKGTKKELLAKGFFNGHTNLAFRICISDDSKLDQHWAEYKIKLAIELRSGLDLTRTNCFRLINGEGDGLPGLICDIYNKTAVLQLDGKGAEQFWNPGQIAEFLKNQIPLDCVYLKNKSSKDRALKNLSGMAKGEVLFGTLAEEVEVLENGARFAINIVDAAKTGLFLDQRDSRAFIGRISKNKTLLNLFGYTGGFSLYAGLAGAKDVWTVDISAPAIVAAQKNWELNGLKSINHQAITSDAFEFMAKAHEQKRKWDIVIADPPSFAPSESAVPNAKKAYIKLFSESMKLVAKNGIFAASSCSGHIDHQNFLTIVEESVSLAKRQGTALELRGQSLDHPYPLACPELRYLKFYAIRLH